MIYHLGRFLDSRYDIPGMGMLQYITFRSALAAILALLIALFIGRRIIDFLRRKQVGETIRDLGLQGQMEKQGTPTMGGLIIIIALLVPVLLFCDLTNIYILLMLLTTVWLGFLGGLDDYIKVFKKHKEGLHGKFKILGQISLGLIVAATVLCSEDIVVREPVPTGTELRANTLQENGEILRDVKSTTTTIPFVKNNEFDYQWLVGFMGDHARSWVWLAVGLVFIFIITAVSNGANLTDGMDGLAAGTSAIICATLVILAYVSGNIIYTRYLNFMYIPNCGELVIFMSALVGALIGFLWYNTNPAQIFMGDTGSLTLGGLIAVCAILIRKELLLPILCGIFLAESASVLIQTSYFKYTRKKYGAGRRVFLMSPLHHHYQKKGFPEPKIVTRFWIVGIILAIVTLATLKVR